MCPSTAHVLAPAMRQLELRETSSRLIGLLRERQKLLAQVTRKKSRLDALLATLNVQQAQMAHLSSKLAPLLAQGSELDHEVHGLFATILARPNLKRKDRRLIEDFYNMLMLGGVLSPAPSPDDDIDELDDASGRESAGFPADAFPPAPDPTAENPSAKRSAGSTATAMRELFRRLATAIHPDKTQDADSREQRTEAMKEVTRAYQDGDLARLLELEKTWLAGEAPDPGNDEDETERRCASLEQTNRELRRQSRELDARMRELKRSAPADLANALGLGGKNGDAKLSDVVFAFQDEIETLRETRDFVQSFVDGKITLAQFVAGPTSGQPQEPEWEPELGALDDFLAEVLLPSGFDFPSPRAPRRRRRR
jgi:hypothetical protein